ncbi:MAG TPA: hypothetical protein VK516_03175, partial [Gemmatimonadaceae bacterium]|nr:hypothetical protein [Gemmatimonadaceae bacterium]
KGMNDMQKVVFSRTLDKATWKNTKLVKRIASFSREYIEDGDHRSKRNENPANTHQTRGES